jgi:hypothetical protein
MRRQPEDYNFGSLIMLAVTVGAFLLVTWVAADFLKTDWQRHVLAAGGYLELGMFDDAALALEEIKLEDKPRNEVLGARVKPLHGS